MLKMISVGLAGAVAALVTLGACSDMGGVGEGNECGGSQDNCSSNLTCQPITGRGHSYCCPTPPEASNYQNCHATQQKDSTPL